MTNISPLRRVTLGTVVGLIVMSASTACADQIILTNGDRVTGSIVKKDGDSLTVKSDLFGLITMPWEKVDSVKADTALTVATKDGKTVRGALALANGNVDVTSGAARETVPVTQVSAIRNADEQLAFDKLEHPGLTDLWAGTATLGWAGSTGNAETLTFTTGVTARRVTRNDKATVYFSSIKASALANGKNSSTAQAVRGGVGYDHNVSPRMFLNAFNDYEYDKFQNLDLRFVIGGGAGYHLIKTDRSLLDVLIGLDYNHSSYSTPATVQSAEAYFGDDYTRKLGKLASFTQTARMFNDLTHTGNYRLNFDAGTTVQLTKWLNWTVAVSDRYLSTPAVGRKTNDLLYITAVGVTFAR
jgi:putative salt-induced outer membrane protein